jgi:hypothetical protein
LIWEDGRGNVDIEKEIIKNGEKINVGEKYGKKDLVWGKGSVEIVDRLLKEGENVDKDGM